ncbi:MAG: hypothetical protein IPK82_15400 [Polyangiaceae bacterium]|nr:hypothetical protein [Polyangiaceae bacterium]
MSDSSNPAPRDTLIPGSSRMSIAGERPSELPPASRTGLDVLANNQGDLPRRRDARDAGTEVVSALFRLVKLSTMHTTDNQAVVQKVEEMVEAVRNYGARAGRNVSVLFLEDTVLIGGLLLQANRSQYDCARELGTLLGKLGVTEVGISKEARAADFYALATALAEALRGPRGTRIAERPTPRVRLRSASPLALRKDATDKLDPLRSAANAYASACVVMRRLYDSLGKGQVALPHRVKRVAQRLVDLSAGEMPAFLGVTDAKRGAHDEAQRAVNAAIITLAMARQITSEPVLLSRLAMAALLFDVGRFHVAGAFPGPGRMVPKLGAEQEKAVPAATAMLLTAMGRVNEPSVMRTVMAYEACSVGAGISTTTLYSGARSPTLQACLIAVARAYVDAISSQLGVLARTADDAVAELSARFSDNLGKTSLRLLIGALGFFPSGTLVELSTGEVAAVVETPVDPALYSLPRIRIVLDMAGHPIDPPTEVDLANPDPDEPARQIRRVVTNNAADVAPVSVRAPISVRSSSIPTHSSQRTAPSPATPLPPRSRRDPVLPAAITLAPGKVERQTVSGDLDNAWDSRALAPPPPPVISDIPPPDSTLESAQDPSSERNSNPLSISDIPVVGVGAPAMEVDRPSAPSDIRLTPIPLGIKPTEPARAVTPARTTELTPQTPSARPVRVIAIDPPVAKTPVPPAENKDETDDLTRAYTHEEAALAESTRDVQAAPSEQTPPPQSTRQIPFAAPEPAPAPPRPQPTAQGTFAKTPFVHLLVYILDQGLTGTASFFLDEETSHDIYFEGGVPAKIKTATPIWPLDRVLVRMNAIAEYKLADALLEVSRTRMLFGRHLVAKGLCSREIVLTALRRQLVLKLVSMCELPAETRYAFYSGVNLIENYGGPELLRSEPLATIMAAVRASAGNAAAESTLARIARAPLGIVAQADVSRFDLMREEMAVCDLLRAKHLKLSEVLAAGVATDIVVKRVVYALAITRYLDLGVAQKPPVALQPTHVPTERPHADFSRGAAG